jgi:hypothetical protein
LLGYYAEFPEPIHGIALFNHQNSTKRIQQAILCALHRLNHEVYDLSAVTPYLKQKCEVGFEFGVAENMAFNFLDEKELEKYLKHISEKELQTLDFFFVIRYHVTRKSGKQIPLRFDYQLLRFTFQKDHLEMQIRHEKGVQRIPIDDFTDFIAERINTELSRRRQNSLDLVHFERVRLQ